ncbi:hypothetical protein LINGRAHAP2_LOCUS24539, partial [Linum grandiflorum]
CCSRSSTGGCHDCNKKLHCHGCHIDFESVNFSMELPKGIDPSIITSIPSFATSSLLRADDLEEEEHEEVGKIIKAPGVGGVA